MFPSTTIDHSLVATGCADPNVTPLMVTVGFAARVSTVVTLIVNRPLVISVSVVTVRRGPSLSVGVTSFNSDGNSDRSVTAPGMIVSSFDVVGMSSNVSQTVSSIPSTIVAVFAASPSMKKRDASISDSFNGSANFTRMLCNTFPTVFSAVASYASPSTTSTRLGGEVSTVNLWYWAPEIASESDRPVLEARSVAVTYQLTSPSAATAGSRATAFQPWLIATELATEAVTISPGSSNMSSWSASMWNLIWSSSTPDAESVTTTLAHTVVLLVDDLCTGDVIDTTGFVASITNASLISLAGLTSEYSRVTVSPSATLMIGRVDDVASLAPVVDVALPVVKVASKVCEVGVVSRNVNVKPTGSEGLLNVTEVVSLCSLR